MPSIGIVFWGGRVCPSPILKWSMTLRKSASWLQVRVVLSGLRLRFDWLESQRGSWFCLNLPRALYSRSKASWLRARCRRFRNIFSAVFSMLIFSENISNIRHQASFFTRRHSNMCRFSRSIPSRRSKTMSSEPGRLCRLRRRIGRASFCFPPTRQLNRHRSWALPSGSQNRSSSGQVERCSGLAMCSHRAIALLRYSLSKLPPDFRSLSATRRLVATS